ncbi:MAG: hypothetical protein GY715_13800 [Planctomycetes bacterium]|nr:hypothetical protein [Planctomycetota bacterium]
MHLDTIGPSALIVGVLYLLARWALITLDYAAAHPGRGRPEVTWTVTWIIALIVSAMGTASLHVWILSGKPSGEVFLFNGIIFGGFLIGFAITGLMDHRNRFSDG